MTPHSPRLLRSSTVTKPFQRLILALLLSLPPLIEADGNCPGDLINPVTDLNWNNLFPLQIGMIQQGGGTNPPDMGIAPVCSCPPQQQSLLSLPTVGIGLSYWEPTYVLEAVTEPGCLYSLGGVDLGVGGETLRGGSDDNGAGEEQKELQVHWYHYPILPTLQLAAGLNCMSDSHLSTLYLTELDPAWQSDLWSIIFTPEAVLFSSLPAQLACSSDVVAATHNSPHDALFWCGGAWGSGYPLSRTSSHHNSDQEANAQIAFKFLSKLARQGGLMVTTGEAVRQSCQAQFNPVIKKSQYRLNPVWPTPHRGAPIPIGLPATLWGNTQPLNHPGGESSVYVVWQAKECCLRETVP